jgi:dolichol-phosphate mannosyltransferase
MEKLELSIVAPVKNEKNNIEWTITEIEKYVKPSHEILIIYDSDKDTTLKVAKKLAIKYKNIKLIKNNYGNGVLNATKKGFDLAKGYAVVMMAADRTDDPKTINLMFNKIKAGYDLVCPTRYSKGGKVKGKLNLKSVLSRFAGLSTPYLLGIPTSDLTYSYKMFRKNILNNINIESKGGFEFAEEIVIKSFLNGYKICEVPTEWNDRIYGKSKFKLLNWLPKYIYWYIFGVIGRIKKILNRN